jgi:dTDP-4-dehydrorhamnose 3,5-epimerase-like enzyme
MKIRKIEAAFVDERGEISDIFYKHQIDHVGIITSVTGALRGDHYHKETTQHMYMAKGSLRYYYRNLDEDPSETKSIVVNEGELISTPPFEIHSLEILESNIFIVFSEGLRGGIDYEEDTFRVTPSLFPKEIQTQRYIDLRS